ncbi:MAG: hypothetical protein ACJ8FY_21760 [Gemmataceae bacterium]
MNTYWSRNRLLCIVCGVIVGEMALGVHLFLSQTRTTTPADPVAQKRPAEPVDDPVPVVVQESAPSKNKESPFITVAREKPVTAKEIKESFDKAKKGALPEGWSGWSTDGATKGFAVSAAKSLSEPHTLACSSDSSRLAARAWLNEAQPADIQVSASVLVETLIPSQILLRGSNLDTTTPDYYAVAIARGLEVQLIRVVQGKITVLASLKSKGYFSGKWVRATVQADGKKILARFCRLDDGTYLNSAGAWQADATWALAAEDEAIPTAGQIGVGRQASYAGGITLDDFAAGKPSNDAPTPVLVKTNGKPASVTVKPAAVTGLPAPVASPVPRPDIPRHYPHIRIALLAYAGNPMGRCEDKLLKESVDLVVPEAAYMKHIHEVAPNTPQMLYSNTSNLYLELLTDWLNFADAQDLPREAAFYHAARSVAVRGNSPSSQPVTWFWSVERGNKKLTDLTHAARTGKDRVAFGGADESVYLGYPDRFREINLELASGANGGWSTVLEYVKAADNKGHATTWSKLATVTDTTANLAQSGQITFDPPPDWKTATLGKPARLFYVRLRTVSGGAGPIAVSILGRDYVNAKGTASGMVPLFDADADKNKDGYLDDKEYAQRRPGKDARFFYESRFASDGYGQMRFCTNVSAEPFRKWAVYFTERLLAKHPFAGGLFMDNSSGKPPVVAADVLEPVDHYSEVYGALLLSISKAIAPRWILANTAGGYSHSEPVIQRCPAYLEEFAIRPMGHHYGFFEDLAAMVERRSALTNPSPLAVIDSHPQRGTIKDPRLLIGTLAYYYLLADPESTFLMFYGGYEPNSTWEEHWAPAAAYDIGKPVGRWSRFASGTDPGNDKLNYRIYQRQYANVLVLYKPLSHVVGVRMPPASSAGNETATKHELKGTYRPLQADGKLGAPVTSVSLRNAEGAILVKEK